jgi:hypothetical protein
MGTAKRFTPHCLAFLAFLKLISPFFSIFRPLLPWTGYMLRCKMDHSCKPPVASTDTEVRTMRIYSTQPLFAWDALEDSPSIQTLRDFLHAIPDGQLLDGLRQARGKGRNDHPVSVLWGVVLLTIVLRHVALEACLDELRRNDDLRRLIGIACENDVPDKWNLSRFLETLGQQPHLTHLRAVFDHLVRRLGVAVPDLGQHSAGDATTLNGRAKKNAEQVADETRQGLPQPSGGRKEYQDDDGTVTKVVEWFGYKLHLIVDVKHEVSLGYRITDTKTGDNEVLPEVLTQARGNLPAGRIQTFAFDKAADDGAVHEWLHDADIKPVIQNRTLWKEEPERSLGGRIPLHIVHDEAGTVFCYDQVSDPPVRHAMAYIGYEPDRETIKYRCPARHEDWPCPSEARCNEGKDYGLTARIPCALDLRRFPPIPRATKQFERLYKGRTAVERVNARLKVFWGADDGNITGARRFHAFVGAIMVVHLALATILASTPRREGTLGKMRLSPIAKKLRQAMTKSSLAETDLAELDTAEPDRAEFVHRADAEAT